MGPIRRTCTLHEHLHNELKQLISVDPPSKQDDKVSQNGSKNISSLDPKSLLKISRDDERQQNKVKVVTRLLDALREDQTGISKELYTDKLSEQTETDGGFIGRIHGCVGAHWELLPPIYADPSCENETDKTNLEDFSVKLDSVAAKDESMDTTKTDRRSSMRKKKSELGSSWLWASTRGSFKTEEPDPLETLDEDESATPSSTKEKIYPLIRGGGLRLPGLDWNKTFRKGYSVLVWVRPTLNCDQASIPDGAAIRKQVLYRFATSLHDNVVGAVGVCAILGQWQAVSVGGAGADSRTLLTTIVTAYTLPNSDPMSHLYPSTEATKKTTTSDETSSKEESAHARNMKPFRQQQQSTPIAAASNQGRLLHKKGKLASMGDPKLLSGKDNSAHSSTSIGAYVTAQLTLPADEWSLIAIQHTHPYLRRPELIISVNGEEIVKGELGYPVLDGVVVSPDEDITGGISALTLSGSASTSPGKAQSNGLSGADFLTDTERKQLKKRGILAECTLLDGAFENGVLADSTEKRNKVGQPSKSLTCVLSVHSLALFPGMVPNVVLAMIAERGPMGDSASGSGLSFLLGPVPTNPQNRDAIVALLAGYGYYGSGGGQRGESQGRGITGGSGHIHDKFLAPPRSIGLPVSIGITPGVVLSNGGKSFRNSSHGPDESYKSDWIGGGDEHAAHVRLQELIGRAILTFHSGDTHTLGHADANDVMSTSRGRIVCQPSAAPSCIGGADEVPKVGIVRPTTPLPTATSARLEVTGSARYHNTTLTYIRNENLREPDSAIAASDNSSKYDDRRPVSFTRAIHAANAVNFALLPFRLAMPQAGNEEVNAAQQLLRSESFAHLSDLLSNQAQLAGLLIELLNECILSSGSTIRDEVLQSGSLHALVNLLRRVLIRGARLGLLQSKKSKRSADKVGRESIDYDQDHESSCPQVIPFAISKAMVQLIDVCCGPISLDMGSSESQQHSIMDPNRGLLRVRRTSDLALTAFFGMALDFDLLGKDLRTAASIIAAIAQRYCLAPISSLNSKGVSSEEPVYGALLRSQMNVQYFLDTIRIRFDSSVSSLSKRADRYTDQEHKSVESIANSLSDILYSMLLSTLTSASGSAVTRGERDIGALVATLTECPFGSICANVVTNAISKLLVKCGVFSTLCLEQSSHLSKSSGRRRDTVDLALENRLARNLLLCHFHDIVAPLILSKSAPNYSTDNAKAEEEKDLISCDVGVVSTKGLPLDWSYDWRLSLLTFMWLSSLAGSDERQATSEAAGRLILEAAKAGSLDHALTRYDSHDNGGTKSNIITVLSQYLVMRSSGEKDVGVTMNKAEATSRRLSIFTQLIPGITYLLLSPSIQRDSGAFNVSHETAFAATTLKEILSMLSLSIQSLYGSKKGGLLTTKPGSNESQQRNRAKMLFISASKEYAPILLQVVIMLEDPIRACKKQDISQDTASEHSTSSLNESQSAGTDTQNDLLQRKRTDSSDKDWVSVQHSPSAASDVTLSDSTTNKASKKEGPPPRRQCCNDLISCQDIALYAVSRLVAQAMKYGGGEASTSVWRVIISALSDSAGAPNTEEGKALKSGENEEVPTENRQSTSKSEKAYFKKTLCHLVALVLSKFARLHEKGSQPVQSQWNPDTCSAVARLMNLVEEKKLLPYDSRKSTPKLSIDQVRLLKALLEVMSSGRESSGWLHQQPIKSPLADGGLSVSVGKTIEDASTQSNYEMYNQQPSKQSNSTTPSVNPNSKLLLPILQSSLRLVLPSMGIIRSEAVVISAASTGKAPSTAVLLKLVSIELDKSITSAISGLMFSVSRDIFMNSVACLHRSLQYHKHVNDAKAVGLCSELVLSVIEAMRRRYVDERNRNENESNGDGEASEGEQQHTAVVERLMLGKDIVPKSDSTDVDFLAFPGDNKDNLKVTPSMGYMEYKGLGSELNRCYRELNQRPSLGTRCLGLSGFQTPEDKAQLALSILEPFIQNWNNTQAHDAAEQELVDLFDESQGGAIIKSSQGAQLSSPDAANRFAEAQSLLKQQHYHLAFEYLVSRRFGKTAFTERLCWKTWMECVDVESCNALWERGIYDGGRDNYSKMATMPMFPQFPRFIPSYLDHSSSSLSLEPPNPEIDLKGQGITIVDITKKEIDEDEMDQLFESNDDGAVDDPREYQEEDLDVLFPKHNESQMSSSVKFSDSQMSSDMNFGRIGDASERSGEQHEDEREADVDQQEQDGANNAEEISMNLVEHGNFHFAASSFSFPPDSSSLQSMGEGVRLAGGMLEEYYSSCLHVKPDCSRKCIVMLTENHLILEYEDGDGVVEGESESHHKKMRDSLSDEQAQEHDQKNLMTNALRPKAMRWNISEASHIYLRRYRLRDSAFEIFFIPSAGATTGGTAFFAGSRSLFIDFGAGVWGNTRRDDAANALMRRAPMQTVKQWPDKSGQFLHDELKKLTQAWSQGAISNFDYLSSLNCLSGRSYNDICQYPVFPWTLCNFTSETVPDLTDKANFRDLSKPIGALNETRLAELVDRFETFADPSIPPFMYGSHYSTSAGVVLHFLLRLHPFSTLHRHLQSGHFDVADRLFSSVHRTWEMCTGRSAAEVKELTPEFYCNPAFLRNTNELKLGTMQEGEVVGDVALPPWANGSAERFIEVMRMALESDVCSEMLGSWIDLIFGCKQQGKQAIEAHNVFFYLTYYGSVDVASIEDEGLRLATECQIAHFGQCPMQLFYRPHIKKRDRSNRLSRQTLSETLGLYDVTHLPSPQLDAKPSKSLPFMDSPMSHWVHLAAPPPGPHSPLISIRLTLSDRCLAVDAKGVYHFFRWAWKPEVDDDDGSDDDDKASDEGSSNETYRDKGCFVAQRELMSFRNIPCLPYTPKSSKAPRNVTVCMSKTLFSNRTLLLVLSDGDGRGGLAMQLVDPVKGAVKGEVIVPSAHADYITAIDMDPIGTAAGQGGVGGELAVVGSADGSITMWRFISSHYWPLRPRLRMMGHSGSKIRGVAISSALGMCASISSHRCCLFDAGNGAMTRVFSPPSAACKDHLGSNLLDENATQVTTFADTAALCLSILGYVAVVCSTKLIRGDEILDEVFSIELMTLEGVHVGSKLLDPDKGLPKKMFASVDGRAVFVCAGRGVSVCLVSAVQPLSFVDEWCLTTEDENDYNTLVHQAIHDIDFGPTISRPVVVAAGCSEGALRLHALQGISKWSHENQRNVVTSAVGSVLALPAQTVKNAIGGVAGLGSRFVGFGKEIGKEVVSAAKEKEGKWWRK